MTHETLTDRIEALFRAHPNQWIAWHQLASLPGGGCAWRSRLTDIRRERGMRLENRLRKVKRPDGSRFTCSEYRFTPVDDVRIQVQEAATC